jgi:putative methionine-R-sulfoxide reductase with GAF domain
MKVVVDALWDALHDKGISWLGFYVDHPTEPDDRRLILGPRRDKPACSPIALHGVCGQTLLGRKVMIVRDVADLGPNYVACDPRDKSEVAIPLLDEAGACWGVFDVDSWDVGAFDERDAAGLAEVLRAAAL